MEAPKSLLKNLGSKLRLMMAEDWRGEDERNTLGMAGYWLDKMGEDQPAKSCQCNDRAAVYRDGVPWCITCHTQILF